MLLLAVLPRRLLPLSRRKLLAATMYNRHQCWQQSLNSKWPNGSFAAPTFDAIPHPPPLSLSLSLSLSRSILSTRTRRSMFLFSLSLFLSCLRAMHTRERLSSLSLSLSLSLYACVFLPLCQQSRSCLLRVWYPLIRRDTRPYIHNATGIRRFAGSAWDRD